MNIRLAHLRQEVTALVPGSNVSRARALYFRTADQAVAVYEQLNTAWYATTRARLMANLAALEGILASAYADGWNTTPFDRELPIAYNLSSTLLYVLASTEAAESPEFRNVAPQAWEDAFGTILDQITAEPLAARRTELMTRLYIAAHPVLGTDVAETIASIRTTYISIALHAAAALADDDHAGESTA